jgi:hypothetical protein
MVVPRRRLVITRRVIATAGGIIGAAVVDRRRCRIDLGAVVAVVIGDAGRKSQTQECNEKNSTIHGGLLDR